MKKLLRFEFHKLLRKRSLYVCGILIVGIAILNVLSANVMWELTLSLNETGLLPAETAAPSAAVLTLQALSSCSFDVLLGIFVALYMCEDVSEGIIKNIYAKGYHRCHVFLAKTIVVMLYCMASALLCFAVSFVSGALLFPNSDMLTSAVLAAVGAQLIVMLSYTSLFALLTTACQKTGGALAASILTPLIVTLILGITDMIAQFQDFSLSSYWIGGMWTSVTSPTASASSLLIACIGGVIYTSLFCLAGLFFSKRKQV